MARRQGFTLSELIVVMGLIGLVTLIATPNVLDWYQEYRLSSSARDVAQMAMLARHKAVGRNTPMTFVLDSTNHIVRIQHVVGPDTIVEEQSKLPDKVSFGDHQTTFRPNGTASFVATDKCQVIQLTARKAEDRFINIFVSGVVRTTSGAAHSECL